MQKSNVLPLVSSVQSLVGNNRLEPRPRTDEFNRSLRAEIRDATWLLARQWQMKEFRAEDRGIPAYAEIKVETAPITQFRKGAGIAQSYAGQEWPIATLGDPSAAAQVPILSEGPVPFAGPMPLEAWIEAQPFAITPGLRWEMGETWVRLLRKNNLPTFVAYFRQHFALAAAAETAADYDLDYALAQTESEIQQLLKLFGGQAVDGYQLYQALATNYRPVLAGAGASEGTPNHAPLKLAAQQFVASYGRLYFSQFNNRADFEPTSAMAWSVPDLAYRFSVALPTQGVKPVVLSAPDYHAQGLHWYSFNQVPGSLAGGLTGFANAPDQVQQATTRFTPTAMRFPGSPNARWWEFEDRKVDFGSITGDSSDLGRMLLQEFTFLYQRDWFSLPYTVPVGSLCTVRQLQVMDVFGQLYNIQPSGASELVEGNGKKIDDDWGRWSMFAQSEQGQRTSSSPRLFIPPVAMGTLVGKPVEQVLLRREEATNLVWGIEQTVPDSFTRGMDGTAAARQLGEYFSTKAVPRPSLVEGQYRYQLATGVPENWIPFLPRPDANGTYHLLQGEMMRLIEGLELRADDRTVRPRTSLLQLGDPAAEYAIHERQVPPTGVRVDSGFRRTRWLNGQVSLWFARSLSSGYGSSNGSSGLAFDELTALTPPPIPAGPVAWYQAEVGVAYDADGLLTKWHDLSGNGLHLFPDDTVGTSAVSPARLNGHAMVRAHRLTTSSNCGIVGNSARCVYVLGRVLEDPASADYSLGTAVVSSGTIDRGQLFECAVSNGEVFVHGSDPDRDTFDHPGPPSVTVPALLAWRYNGSGHSYTDFNDLRGAAGGPASFDTANTPLNLAYGLSYGVRPVDFLEVIVYNRFLTAAEDAQVRAYLGSKGNVPV